MRDNPVRPILPPKENEGEPVTTSIRIPKGMLAKLDLIARESNYSRSEVMLHFFRWAIVEYDNEKKGKK